MPRPITVACAVVVLSCLTTAQGPIQLHNGGVWSNSTVPSVIWTNPPTNQEAADDFNVVGTVTRVVANGSGCWQCAPAALSGVWVRFYAWQSGNPGALQYQAFVPAGSPGLVYNPANIEVIDIVLPTPFAATGQHFVSIQASFVIAGYWSLWVCDWYAPTWSPVKFRDNLGSGTWGSYSSPGIGAYNCDLDLELWGYPATPPAQPTDPCGAWDVVSPPAPAGSYHTLLRDLKVIAWNDVWAVGDATIGTIGNLSTHNAAWHWDGNQWTQAQVPNPAPGGSPNNALWAIDASGPNDVYAAGHQSITVPGGWYGPQLEVVHWDGTQWSVLPNTPIPPTSIGAGVSGAHINDVDVLASNDVWFAGFWLDLQPTGVVTQPGLLMRYDGSNFMMTAAPTVPSASTQGQTFTKIEAIAPNDVWAVGYRHGLSSPAVPSGAPVVVHWNGSQWSSLSPPIPGTPSIIADIEALGPNDVRLLGYYTPTGAAATPFMIQWNGSAWAMMPTPPGGSSLKAFAPNDIYAGGAGGVWHFDGASWAAVQAFPSLTSASFATIDGVVPCQLWGGGGQWVVGQAVPFVARQPSIYSHTALRSGCLAGGTPGAIVALTPPRIGTLFDVGLSDPAQTLQLTGGGLSYWVVSAAKISNAGCGAPIAGIGGGGGFGELLIDLGATVFTSGPSPWAGGASVNSHGVFIPNVPQVAGIQAYSQGALLDAANPSHLIVTPALDIRVGY